MSPVNKETIEEKLANLNDQIEFLEEMRKVSFGEFINDAKNYNSVMFALINAIETIKENFEMAKFRNKIIHIYKDVLLEEVYKNLQKAPDIFRQFAKHYLEFLEKAK